MTAPFRQAVEAALEAWYTTPTDYVFETKPEADARQMLAALTAAMPRLLAARAAEIAALRAEFKEVNSQLTEAAGMAFRYRALLNDALWWLRKHNRHADLRGRIEKELAPIPSLAALEMSGGVK